MQKLTHPNLVKYKVGAPGGPLPQISSRAAPRRSTKALRRSKANSFSNCSQLCSTMPCDYRKSFAKGPICTSRWGTARVVIFTDGAVPTSLALSAAALAAWHSLVSCCEARAR